MPPDQQGPLSPETHETLRAGRGGRESQLKPPATIHAMKRTVSSRHSMPLAIRAHPLECFRPFWRRRFGDDHQLAHAESLNQCGSVEGREVVLRLFRQMQQAEHLRHPCLAKSLLFTNLRLGQRLVLAQASLPIKDAPDRMPGVLAAQPARVRPPVRLEPCISGRSGTTPPQRGPDCAGSRGGSKRA